MRLTRLTILPLAGLLLAAAQPATPLYQAPQAQADRVRATVEFLADDLLEGRAAGERGHEMAALYVASRFRALGMEPGGDNSSWYQRVPFRRATIDGTPTASVTIGGQTTALAAGTDFAVHANLTQRDQQVAAPLVFAGYGISDPQLGMNDYAGLDVRGKIVVLLGGTPKGLAPDISAHLVNRKLHMAAAAGAIGVISVAGNGAPRTPPITDWIDAKGQVGSVPAGIRARAVISRGLAERLFAGRPMTFAQVLAERQTGKPVRGFPLNATMSLQARSAWTDFTSPEVIGRVPGSDPTLAREYVALTAHLDHEGMKKDAKPGEDAIYNGALDNAAGIATMLEAAERFMSSGQRPKRSLLFIAHTAEERGLLGADYWATHPTVPIGSVVANVNLDMPVPLYDFSDVVAFGADHSTVARTVAAAGATMGVTVSPDPMPEQGIFTRSDHYPLVLQGVPSVLLFTGYGKNNAGKAIWDKFFAETYHQVSDDLKQPINWGALARYGELNYRIARTLADDPQRARWYGDSYFGRLVAPNQPKAQR